MNKRLAYADFVAIVGLAVVGSVFLETQVCCIRRHGVLRAVSDRMGEVLDRRCPRLCECPRDLG